MNSIDIIRIAKESGMAGLATTIVCEFSELKRFAALVASAEREACAKACEVNHGTIKANLSSFDCAAAIRARSQA